MKKITVHLWNTSYIKIGKTASAVFPSHTKIDISTQILYSSILPYYCFFPFTGFTLASPPPGSCTRYVVP